MEKENQSMEELNQSIAEVNEKIRTAKSLLIVLETDLSSETADNVYLDVIKVVHSILNEAQQIIASLQ